MCVHNQKFIQNGFCQVLCSPNWAAMSLCSLWTKRGWGPVLFPTLSRLHPTKGTALTSHRMMSASRPRRLIFLEGVLFKIPLKTPNQEWSGYQSWCHFEKSQMKEAFILARVIFTMNICGQRLEESRHWIGRHLCTMATLPRNGLVTRITTFCPPLTAVTPRSNADETEEAHQRK